MLDKLENELKTRGFSQKTIDSYLLHNKDFLKFINKEPEKAEEIDIKNYLSYLTSEKKYKARSVNLAMSALKFSFYNLFNRRIMENVKLLKLDKRISSNLTKEEIKSLIENVDNPKHKLLLKLMAYSGLKAGEVIKLKIKDLNLDEKIINI